MSHNRPLNQVPVGQSTQQQPHHVIPGHPYPPQPTTPSTRSGSSHSAPNTLPPLHFPPSQPHLSTYQLHDPRFPPFAVPSPTDAQLQQIADQLREDNTKFKEDISKLNNELAKWQTNYSIVKRDCEAAQRQLQQLRSAPPAFMDQLRDLQDLYEAPEIIRLTIADDDRRKIVFTDATLLQLTQLANALDVKPLRSFERDGKPYANAHAFGEFVKHCIDCATRNSAHTTTEDSIAILTPEAKAIEEENSRLKASMQKLQSQLDQLQLSHTRFQSSSQQSQDNLTSKVRELELSLSSSHKSLSAKRLECISLMAERDEISKIRSDLETRLDTVTDHRDQLLSQVAKLEEKNSIGVELRKELSEARETVDELCADHSALKIEADRLRKENENLKARLNAWEREVELEEEKRIELERRLEEERRELEVELEEEKRRVEDLEGWLEEEKRKVEEVERDKEDAIAARLATSSDHTSQLQIIEDQLRQQLAIAEQLQSQLTTTKQRETDAAEEGKKLSHQLKESGRQLADARQSHERAIQSEQKLHDDNKTLRKQAQDLRSQIQELRTQLEDLQEDAKIKEDKLTSEVASRRSAIDKAKAEVKALKRKLETQATKSGDKVKAVQDQLEEANTSIDKLRSELKTAKDYADTHSTLARQSGDRIRVLDQELKSSREAIEESDAKESKLSRELADVQDKLLAHSNLARQQEEELNQFRTSSSEISILRAQMGSLIMDKTRNEHELTQLRTDLKQREEALGTLTADYERVKGVLPDEEIQVRNRELENMCRAFKHDWWDMKEKVEEREKELAMMREPKTEEARKCANCFRDHMSFIRQDVDRQMSAERPIKLSIRENFYKELDKKNETIGDLRKQVEDLKMKLERLKQNMKAPHSKQLRQSPPDPKPAAQMDQDPLPQNQEGSQGPASCRSSPSIHGQSPISLEAPPITPFIHSHSRDPRLQQRVNVSPSPSTELRPAPLPLEPLANLQPQNTSTPPPPPLSPPLTPRSATQFNATNKRQLSPHPDARQSKQRKCSPPTPLELHSPQLVPAETSPSSQHSPAMLSAQLPSIAGPSRRGSLELPPSVPARPPTPTQFSQSTYVTSQPVVPTVIRPPRSVTRAHSVADTQQHELVQYPSSFQQGKADTYRPGSPMYVERTRRDVPYNGGSVGRGGGASRGRIGRGGRGGAHRRGGRGGRGAPHQQSKQQSRSDQWQQRGHGDAGGLSSR